MRNCPCQWVRELATELTGQRKPLLRHICSEPLVRQEAKLRPAVVENHQPLFNSLLRSSTKVELMHPKGRGFHSG